MAGPGSILVIGRGALGLDVAQALAARHATCRVTLASTAAQAPHGALALDLASPLCARTLADAIADSGADTVAMLALSESPATPENPWDYDSALVGVVTSAFDLCAARGGGRPAVLLLSSTAVYGVARGTPLVFDERTVPPRATAFDSAPARWAESHRQAERAIVSQAVSAGARVGVVRAASVLGGPVDSPLAALLSSALPVRVLGYDPPCQAIHYEDLVDGLVLALEQECAEVVNLVGRGVAPLSRVMALAGTVSIPVPGPLADRLAPRVTDGDHLRWRTLADGRRAEALLGFRPRKTLEDCLRARR